MNVETMIRNHIADNILFSKGYPYPDEASFLEGGIVDSANVMELVLFVEEKFGISVEDAELVPANFDSVKQMGAYVRNKMQNKMPNRMQVAASAAFVLSAPSGE
jgi:acyl carrier protein